MKLIDFLKLVPDTQEMWLSYESFVVQGTEDSLGCMLGEDVYKGIVTDVEAEGDLLKVWAKEEGT